ncbi:hypothetical protein AB0D67_02500 [Streptosporangium sp. NPDC048047]|uniref:hypothetical protein n=1 Tax=Streptosporangium sp. NPDC048047 TaxID=3155748 RepID=UPI0034470AD4
MLDALDHIELEQAQGYIDEVLAMLPTAARQILEAMMSTGTREYKSRYARHYYGQGKAEGIAEGEVRGEAKMLLLILTARGIEVPQDARELILACTDLERIEAWGRRAGTVASIDELLG